jgi:BirA family transcriptional regulator, biotin operon repressor / biotin---[acetyl-CoA-carboxylase] ligase
MTLPLRLDWMLPALQARLQPLLPGLQAQAVAETGSTNADLLAWPRTLGAPGSVLAPCLRVAEVQTAGRGRLGRSWDAAAGRSLTFSLGLPYAPRDWSGLSLAVGLAVATALDPLATPTDVPRLWLKWPNDLMLRPAGAPAAAAGKLGGVLIETLPWGDQPRWTVIGIGLNLQAVDAAVAADPAAPLPPWPRAALQALDPALATDAPAVLARVLPRLAQVLLDFVDPGFAALHPAWSARDLLHGLPLVTTLPAWPDGVADGVDAQGCLWLRRGAARHALASGEVSVRPAAVSAGLPPA